MSRKLISIACIILIFTWFSYYFVSGLPQYTFYLIYKSIRSHDVESFYKYVDVDSIVDNLINDAWKETMQKEQPKNEWEALGAGLAQTMKPMAKTMLTDLAKQEITSSIENIKQPPKQETLVEETPVKVFMNKFKTLKDFSKIKVKISGKIAEVEISSFKKDESLTMKMRKTPQRYWKIVSIRLPSQPKEIKTAIQEETKPKVEEGLISSSAYLEYYKEVRSRIGKVAYSGYNRKEVGEVYLVFTIQSDGELKDIRVVEEKSSNSPYLRQIAIEAVQAAAPFPIFPDDLKYPQLSFKVVLSYEIE